MPSPTRRRLAGPCEAAPPLDFIAHAFPEISPLPLEPADLKREWMEGEKRLTAARHPGIARGNQAGWVLRCPINVNFTWNGDMRPHQGITSYSHDADRDDYYGFFSNAFGHGVLTVSIPYLFRTPPGYGLLVRGASNFWVENMQPLDGLVETDWLESSFTMNWRILEPNKTTGFKKGDPICMIVPYPLALLEAVTPRLVTTPEPLQGHSPAVSPAGGWRHVLSSEGPGLATEKAPGKARLRLKRFER